MPRSRGEVRNKTNENSGEHCSEHSLVAVFLAVLLISSRECGLSEMNVWFV